MTNVPSCQTHDAENAKLRSSRLAESPSLECHRLETDTQRLERPLTESQCTESSRPCFELLEPAPSKPRQTAPNQVMLT